MEKQMIKKLQDKRSNKKWTAKEIQDLLQFKSQGFSNSEIGAYLQRSEKAIDLKMSKLRTAIKGAGMSVDNPPSLTNLKPYTHKFELPKKNLMVDRISERRIELSKQEKMEKTIAKLTWVIWVGAICGVFWIGTMVGKIL